MRNQKGFTLVELIVVIVIIGILAAVAVPRLMNLTDTAQVTACQQTRMNLLSEAQASYAQAVATGSTDDMATWYAAQDWSRFTCPAGGTFGTLTTGTSITGITCSEGSHEDVGTGS